MCTTTHNIVYDNYIKREREILQFAIIFLSFARKINDKKTKKQDAFPSLFEGRLRGFLCVVVRENKLSNNLPFHSGFCLATIVLYHNIKDSYFVLFFGAITII